MNNGSPSELGTWKKKLYKDKIYIINKMDLLLIEGRKIAMKSPMLQKHSALIVHRNKIIATGFNHQYETNNYFIHAEEDALNKIRHLNKNIIKVVCDVCISI